MGFLSRAEKLMALGQGRAALPALRGEVLLPAAAAQTGHLTASASADADGFSVPLGRLNPTFDAGGHGRRSRNWPGVASGPNAVIGGYMQTLRARAHQQAFNNEHVVSALEAIVRNVVGDGVRPAPNTSDTGLNRDLEEAWDEWVHGSDPAGTLDFYGQQALMVRSTVEAGEAFARHHQKAPNGRAGVPYQVQLFEPELCPVEKTEMAGPGRVIKMGIEFDGLVPVAYWVRPRHPNEFWPTSDNNEPVRIPADQILHVFRPMRIGQIRGFPWFTPGMAGLFELDAYESAEVARKHAAACIAGFITMTGDLGEAESGPIPGLKVSYDPTASEAELEPGSFSRLRPGESVEFSNPADVGPNYDKFLVHGLRKFAAHLGITYEQMSGDLSQVNYSSIRAGLIEVRQGFEMLQQRMLVHQFCRPAWKQFVEAMVIRGDISPPRGVQLATCFRCGWVGPGWHQVDPQKETISEILERRAGLVSRAMLIRKRGGNVRAVEREIEEEDARADAREGIFDTDARRVARGGARQREASGEEVRQTSGERGVGEGTGSREGMEGTGVGQ